MTLNTFTSEQPRKCFNVSITNDTIVELNEAFTARLTLVPASVATITADRIIVDPPEATVQITNNDLSKLIIVIFTQTLNTLAYKIVSETMHTATTRLSY